MSKKRKSNGPRSLFEIVEEKFSKETHRDSSMMVDLTIIETDLSEEKKQGAQMEPEERLRDFDKSGRRVQAPLMDFSRTCQQCMENSTMSPAHSDPSGAAASRLEELLSKSPTELLVSSNALSSSADQTFGFCCFRCKCTADIKDKFLAFSLIEGDQLPNVLVFDRQAVRHRRCCHRVTCKGRWLPPFEAAIERHLKTKVLGGRKSHVLYSQLQIREVFDKSERLEKELFNADYSVDPLSLLQTNPDYLKMAEQFRAHVCQLPESNERGCIVLEIFGGIGSGTVALKRLGICLKKIVYVDHDEVALHVFRHNHDNSYNGDLAQDDAEYVFYRRFEDVSENLDELMRLHGPFDLILGGPPCVDYTTVNARRQGFEGNSGNLMIQVGQLVNRIQSHPLQRGTPLYFLVENVVLRGDDLDQACLTFGITPLLIDSSCFSPCRRIRMYWVNFALHNVHFNDEESSLIMPSSCLDDNYHLAGTLLGNLIRVKSYTFMASKARLDDHRMMVFTTDVNKPSVYHGRPLNVEERGRMMGFPEGYVTEALELLFESLSAALGFNYLNTGLHWRDNPDIPERFLHFSGERFRFDISGLEEQVVTNLQIARPDSDEYYCREMYGKRLYGNAWSIPTVEKLLEPLNTLFASKLYNQYPYRYAFESGTHI